MVNRDGRFKVADGGTLFLDKVGHASGHDEPWGWNERGQFLEQGQWRQDKMRRTIRRRAPHPVSKPPIRPLLEAL